MVSNISWWWRLAAFQCGEACLTVEAVERLFKRGYASRQLASEAEPQESSKEHTGKPQAYRTGERQAANRLRR